MSTENKKTGKIIEAGRPAGAPNKGNDYGRNMECHFRCTEGFMQVIAALKKQDPTGKLSTGIILHDALQMYAVRKLSSKGDMYWVKRIQ